MSANNGVIRVGRKGLKKFAFGDDGAPFEVDVVVAFQQWICIDEQIREQFEDRLIPAQVMQQYHQAAVDFVGELACRAPRIKGREPEILNITTAEALDFIARLREQYDEVADFFHARSKTKPSSVESLEARFSPSET